MPILPIGDHHSWPHVGDVHAVMACMSFPTDEAKRFGMLNASQALDLIVSLLSHPDPEIAAAADKVVELQSVDVALRPIRSAWERALRGGEIVGQILLYIRAADEVAPKYATINKAMQVVTAQGASLASVKSAWRSLRSVSHLWAAMLYVTQTGASEGTDFGAEGSAAQLPTFLAIAEDFRRFGEARMVKPAGAAPAPLLPISSAWTVPQAILLPAVTVVDLSLSSWVLDEVGGANPAFEKQASLEPRRRRA